MVYIIGSWETFHRRQMLEALARNMEKKGFLFCCSFPCSIKEAWQDPRQLKKRGILPLFGPQQVAENIFIGTPCVWIPGIARHAGQANSLSWRMVSIQIKRALKNIAPNECFKIAWVYKPEHLYCLGLIEEDMTIYECYDEYQLDYFNSNPLPQVALLENELLMRANMVFITSKSLLKRGEAWKKKIFYAPNGVSFNHFVNAFNHKPLESTVIVSIPKPRLGFVGNISRFLDLKLIEEIARKKTNWSLILIGPVDESAKQIVEKWASIPNIYLLGRVDFCHLPLYLKDFDVALAPFQWNELCYHINPLKVWEYLAAGKPVVASLMSELESLSDIIYLARDRNSFLKQVENALESNNLDRIQRGIHEAEKHSWNQLTASMLDLILSEIK